MGNWAPFVAGANTESDGSTYVKLGWNPIYTNAYSNKLPEFGMEVVCDGDDCEGLPCKFDPASNGFNEMTGDYTIGDGGAAFCVVTVPSGKKANIVIFEGSGSEPTSTSSTSAAPTHTSKPATSKAAATSSPSTDSSPSSATSSDASSSGSDPKKGSHHASATASGGIFVSASASASFSYAPHVFIETGSSDNTMPSQTSSMTTMTTMTSAASTASTKAAATSSSSSASSNAVPFMSLALTVFIAGLLSSS